MCPCFLDNIKCKRTVFYKSKQSRDVAEQNQSLCVSCNTKRQHHEGRGVSWKGENNPFFGSKRTGELNPFYGKTHADTTKEILRSYSGEKHHAYGKTWYDIYSDAEKVEQRKKNIKNQHFNDWANFIKGLSWE